MTAINGTLTPSADEFAVRAGESSQSYTASEVLELLTQAHTDPHRQTDLWAQQLAVTLRRELWDTSRIVVLAADSLRRPERFPSEHKVASDYLRLDVPRLREQLHAQLHILDHAGDKMRRDFILGDQATRERLIAWVLHRGGIYHRRHRDDVHGVWVELAI